MNRCALTTPEAHFEQSTMTACSQKPRRLWSPEEDDCLVRARILLGTSAPWSQVAKLVAGRTGPECCDRFHKNIKKSARWRKNAPQLELELKPLADDAYDLEEFSFEAILGLGEQTHLGSVVTTEDGHDVLNSLMMQGGLYPPELEHPQDQREQGQRDKATQLGATGAATAAVQALGTKESVPKATLGAVRFKKVAAPVKRFDSTINKPGAISKAVLLAPITKLSYLGCSSPRQQSLASQFKKINSQMATSPKPKRVRQDASPECKTESRTESTTESMKFIPGVSAGMMFNAVAIRC